MTKLSRRQNLNLSTQTSVLQQMNGLPQQPTLTSLLLFRNLRLWSTLHSQYILQRLGTLTGSFLVATLSIRAASSLQCALPITTIRINAV